MKSDLRFETSQWELCVRSQNVNQKCETLKQTLNKRAIFSLLKNYIIIVKHRFLSLTCANKLY